MALGPEHRRPPTPAQIERAQAKMARDAYLKWLAKHNITDRGILGPNAQTGFGPKRRRPKLGSNSPSQVIRRNRLS